MPAYCEPWPVNRNATSRPSAGRRRARERRLAILCPRRRPASRSASCARSSRRARQPVSEDARGRRWRCSARSASGTSGSRRPGARPSAWPARAAPSVGLAPRASAGGAAARSAIAAPCRLAAPPRATTWALVPLKPNELTPATRGWPPRGHGVGRVGIASGVPSSAMCGLSCSKCRCGGIAPCSQRPARLDQAGHAGRRFEVADVRLHRADHSRRSRPRPSGRSTAPSACDLDRVAERRAGAVRLDVADVARRRRRRVRQRLADHRLLRRAVRRGEAAAAAVLVDRRCRGSRARMRSPSRRASREPLQHDHAAALAADVAVGRARRTSCSGRRRRASAPARSAMVASGDQDQVDAAGERQVALARAQALARQVDRDQRRRAGGVDGEARALQAEQVARGGRTAMLCAMPVPRSTHRAAASPCSSCRST